MLLTLHATRRTPHGASRLVQAMSAWLVKTRCAPPRHSRDARVYGHTTTAMHKLSTPPPSAPPPPPPPHLLPPRHLLPSPAPPPAPLSNIPYTTRFALGFDPHSSLAIGDMEDDGVGEENAAKVAAFFDVVLDSPRVSHGAAAAAAAAALTAAPPGGGGSNSDNNSNGMNNGSVSGNGNGSGNTRASNGSRVGNGSGSVNNRGSHRSSNRSNSNRSGNRSGNSNPHGSGSIDGRRKDTTEEDRTESRVSSTAKQWMYGGGDEGSME